jgi:EamA domain-containing membrane protein RarD
MPVVIVVGLLAAVAVTANLAETPSLSTVALVGGAVVVGYLLIRKAGKTTIHQ